MRQAEESTVLIINANAGSRNISQILAQIEKLPFTLPYKLTHSEKEMDAFVEEARHTYDTFILYGGDGTVNSILKHLYANPELKIGILPSGSGNGFARELGFTKDLNRLIERINNGEIQKVDLIRVNDSFSCNVVGLGIDSLISAKFEKREHRGLSGYIPIVTKAVFNFKGIDAQIEFDGQTIDGHFLMINIANTRQFGNNAFIAPHAKHDDSILELALVKRIPFYQLPIVIYKMFTKKLKAASYLTYYRVRKISIKSNSEYFHVDGEPRCMNEKLDIQIVNQINVIKMN